MQINEFAWKACIKQVKARQQVTVKEEGKLFFAKLGQREIESKRLKTNQGSCLPTQTIIERFSL